MRPDQCPVCGATPKDIPRHVLTHGVPALNAEEQVVMDKLLEVRGDIINGWRLRANHAELDQAIHVIQGFIVQRMLQRLNPAAWGSWYDAS